MSILKFFKNLLGMSNNESSSIETPTKVEEPVVELSTKEVEKVDTKVEEVKEEVKVESKKVEEPKKTAKEIKAKVRKPYSNNNTESQKSSKRENTGKPRPSRRRPQQKKSE